MLTDLSHIQVPLPWQQSQWQGFLTRLKEGTAPHAVLLRGEPGTGKGQFALALAQYLLCESPVADTACGKCKGCLLNLGGAHPDMELIEPEEQDKAIKVDQIRAVVNFVGKKAQLAGYRIVVLCPAEAMNINSSNALLKSLEEPGEATLLILVSHQVSALLPTIRSRCQVVEFPIPDRAEAISWLSAVVGDEHKSDKLLNVAGGAPVRALQLNDSEWLGERATVLQQWLSVLDGKRDAIRTAESWAQYPIRELLAWLLAWQIDIVKLVAQSQDSVLNQDLIQDLQWASRQINPSRLFACHDHLIKVKSLLQSQANPNPQLLLEEILLKWSQARSA